MLTDSLVKTLAAKAGSDFTYPGVSGSARPPAKSPDGRRPRVGMRLWLYAAQGGLCPTCGQAIANPLVNADLAHVVGSGPKRAGFMAGNIYLSHPSCNIAVARATREGVSGTEANVTRIMAWLESEGLTVATVIDAYTLILAPEDFTRPDLIAVEWPCSTTGGFRVFDTVTARD